MPDGRNQAARMPGARLGRWSVVMALAALVLLAVGAIGLVMARNGQAGTPSSAAVFAAVAALWLSRLLNLVGVVLGVIGLVRQGAGRYVSAAGLAANVAMIFGGDWLAGQFALLFAGS